MIVDHSRACDYSKGDRTLLTEIWYPATDETRSLPPNKLSDFLLRGQAPPLLGAIRLGFGVKAEDLDATYKNVAVRDARVRDGKFPLIVFSHGNGGMRFQSTFWCDHMASHGYVVMSCDHTGNAAATMVNGRMVLMDRKGREQAAKDRPLDVSAQIDLMARWNKGGDSRFTGRIDVKNIAVAGHSFGGYTAGAVINTDDRVKAIIPMTPVFGPRTNDRTPLLLFLGAEDATIGVEGNRRAMEYYEATKGPKYLVNVLDAGHFSFSDMGQFRPDFGDGFGTGKRVTKPDESIDYLDARTVYEITNSYSVAFLGITLKGQEGYRDYLETNHYGDIIEFEAAPEPATTATK